MITMVSPYVTMFMFEKGFRCIQRVVHRLQYNFLLNKI